MLTEQEINEILDSNEALTEYVTASMVQAISAGLKRAKNPDTPPSAVAQMIDVLRKARGDLTGATQQQNMPTMNVNIQFSGSQPQQGQVVDGTATRVDTPLQGSPPSALGEVSNIAGGDDA